MLIRSEDAQANSLSTFGRFEHLRLAGMAGRYTGSYLDQWYDWRAGWITTQSDVDGSFTPLGEAHEGLVMTADDKARQTAHGLIQSYIGPDHKVIDMKAFYSALVQALREVRRFAEKASSLPVMMSPPTIDVNQGPRRLCFHDALREEKLVSASQRIGRGFHYVLLVGLSTVALPAEVSPQKPNRQTVSRNQEQFRIYADADAPGYDYYQQDPPSLRYCQNRCAEHAKCRAFTYNTAKKVCFLKHKASARLKFNAGAITGRKSGVKKFIIRKNRDAPGNDYERLDPPTLTSCQRLCGADIECKAFTYNAAKKVCFLKYKGDIPLVPFKEAVAGIKVAQTRSTRAGGITEVPLEHYGGTFRVPVLINDILLLHFMVDSGASSVVIPFDVFGTLSRTGTLDVSDVGDEGKCIVADGSETPCFSVRIRKLKVGSHVVTNVDGTVMGLESDLLLGQSFLRRFKSWSIDNNRQVLILE